LESKSTAAPTYFPPIESTFIHRAGWPKTFTLSVVKPLTKSDAAGFQIPALESWETTEELLGQLILVFPPVPYPQRGRKILRREAK